MDTVRGVSASDEDVSIPAAEDGAERPPAWEQIEDGRYMPRRIRGSCMGRELG
jgi:hypothetical protein